MSYLKTILKDAKLKHFVVPEKIPIALLDVAKSFNLLSDQEKMYAHYLSQASWEGYPITVEQASAEAIPIFYMLQSFFRSFSSFEEMEERVKKETNEETFVNFMNYCVQFYGNGGNYLSFGDTKFVPRLEKEDFEKVILMTEDEEVKKFYIECKERLFSLNVDELELGFHDAKTNSLYYSPNIKQEEVKKINVILKEKKKIYLENTRIFKLEDNKFQVRIASGSQKAEETFTDEETGYTLVLSYGDYHERMNKIAENLGKAIPFASNENEKKMLEKYVSFFREGRIDDHIDSQRFWVANKGPIIETNIGFIESYRDPNGTRGEYEGWVAVVNKDASKKYEKLVQNAESMISSLPWNEKGVKGFEKDRFLKPDYTSLDVLTFASSGVPLGINVPNYMEVRQDFGFKNVTLGNVMSAFDPNEEIDFLTEQDQELYKKYNAEAGDVGVCLHELLGHGTGKLLCEGKFDPKSVINPLTNKPVEKCYKEGESWESVFESWCNPYEECRAESVSMYLADHPKISEVFELDEKQLDDVAYLIWLEMAWKGLRSLPYYSPANSKWMQAHCCARFVILQVLLEAGIVKIEEKGEDDLLLLMDREKLSTVGKEALGQFLLRLMVFKATANKEEGIKFFEKYTLVGEKFLKYRELVISKKKPRKVFVQCATKLVENKVELMEFESSYKGMVGLFQSLFTK